MKTISTQILIAAALGGALAVTSVCVASTNEMAGPLAVTNSPSKFRSAEVGWLDISVFMDQSYGFAPIVFPITEPAIGYGLAGGLAFVDKPQGAAEAGFGRPDITAVGGMFTEKGACSSECVHWQAYAGRPRRIEPGCLPPHGRGACAECFHIKASRSVTETAYSMPIWPRRRSKAASPERPVKPSWSGPRRSAIPSGSPSPPPGRRPLGAPSAPPCR